MIQSQSIKLECDECALCRSPPHQTSTVSAQKPTPKRWLGIWLSQMTSYQRDNIDAKLTLGTKWINGSGTGRCHTHSYHILCFVFAFNSIYIYTIPLFVCVAASSEIVMVWALSPAQRATAVVRNAACECVCARFNCIIVINLPLAKLINFRLATFKILFSLSLSLCPVRFFVSIRQFGRRFVTECR